MKKVIPILTLFIIFFACKKDVTLSNPPILVDQSLEFEAELEEEPEITSVRSNSVSPPPIIEEVHEAEALQIKPSSLNKKLTKKGTVVIQVDSLDRAKQKLDIILKKLKGYYANEAYREYTKSDKYDLSIRIPHEYYDEFLRYSNNAIGRLISKDLKIKDVTRDYHDTQLRLKNKRVYLKRYTELLNKAKKVEDILKIQEKMRWLEEEIESSEGSLRYYNHNIAYSEIRLCLQKSHPEVIPKATYANSAILAFTDGYNSILRFCIYLLARWPMILVIGIILILRKWIFRRVSKWFLEVLNSFQLNT